MARRRKFAQVRNPAECLAQIRGQRANVRAGRAGDLDVHHGIFVDAIDDVANDVPMNRYHARLAYDLTSLAGDLMQTATTNFYRRHHRRDLLDLTDEVP